LNVNFANVKAADANAGAAAGTVGPLTGITATGSTSTNFLSGNYTMGNATVYAGWNKGKTLGAAAASSAGVYYVPAVAAGLDTNGSRLGFKYVMGATNFIVSTAKQTIHDSASAEHTRKVNGFRATQELSKQTSIYVAYEQYNAGNTYSDTTKDGGKYNVTAVGIRRQF
jgi:predicted porin